MDFVTVDFSMGEYMPDLGEAMPELRDYLINHITEKYRTKVLYTTHIIQQEDCVKVPDLSARTVKPTCQSPQKPESSFTP